MAIPLGGTYTTLSSPFLFSRECVSAEEVVVEANAFHDPLVFMTGGFGGSSLESGASLSQE